MSDGSSAMCRFAWRAVAVSLWLAVPAACAPGKPPPADVPAAQPAIGNAERSGAAERPPGGSNDALDERRTQVASQGRDSEGVDSEGVAPLARGTELDTGLTGTKPPTIADRAERDRVMQGAAAARREDAERLQRQLEGLQAKETPRGIVVTFGNVVFKTNSAELLPGAAANLDRLASYLRERPSSTVQVEGYTDSSSSTDYNLALSQRRADSLRHALVARGVDSSRIGSRGYGATAPVAGNDTAQGRQMNRRVEVVIDGSGGQVPQASGATP
jgi:outer membrane protein OmpA-like peptidoglycan-associated protein